MKTIKDLQTGNKFKFHSNDKIYIFVRKRYSWLYRWDEFIYKDYLTKQLLSTTNPDTEIYVI